MARQKKSVHRVQMTEGKRNIIHQLLEEYDIQSAEDIQDALKDLDVYKRQDRMLADFLDLDMGIGVNIHIKSIDQSEAIKTVKRKITDLDKMKIEEQKKAVRSGYDTVSYTHLNGKAEAYRKSR